MFFAPNGLKDFQLYIDDSYLAYGLVKIVSTYNGPAIRIRRSSDSFEIDIYFIKGRLDTASIISFLFAETSGAIITIIYDQNGTGFNLLGQGGIVSSYSPIVLNKDSNGNIFTSTSSGPFFFATDNGVGYTTDKENTISTYVFDDMNIAMSAGTSTLGISLIGTDAGANTLFTVSSGIGYKSSYSQAGRRILMSSYDKTILLEQWLRVNGIERDRDAISAGDLRGITKQYTVGRANNGATIPNKFFCLVIHRIKKTGSDAEYIESVINERYNVY